MKSSVKILITVLALGVMASSPALQAQADAKAPPAGGQGGGQRGQRGGGRGGMTVASIETAVGTLTADQKAKITPILEKAQADRQALMSGGGDQQANMAKMQEMRTATNKEIRAILTGDQQTKFDEMVAQQGRRGGGGGGRRGGGGGGGGGGGN